MTTRRAAIYARFSSDRQRDRSIDDQIAMCREFAAARAWSIAATFTDHATSAATVHRRPGYSAMLADAERGRFEILIAEDIDRLARGEGDAPQLRRNLEFLGI